MMCLCDRFAGNILIGIMDVVFTLQDTNSRVIAFAVIIGWMGSGKSVRSKLFGVSTGLLTLYIIMKCCQPCVSFFAAK